MRFSSFVGFTFLPLVVCLSSVAIAQDQSLDNLSTAMEAHLAGGEFGAVRDAAMHAPIDQRDPIFGQIASAQSSAGEPVAAARTVRSISSGSQQASAIEGAGAGGGAFADFDSLMQLIQTTVVPETWEALGGPSTLAPYPQGVYVDPDGTVSPCKTLAESDALENLRSLLSSSPHGNADPPTSRDEFDDGEAWRQQSELRIVSLKRLQNEINRQRMFGQGMKPSVLHLGGLSRIQFIILQDDDVLIAGPVGGIDEVNGWYRDRVSGLNTLRSDFLFTCLSASLTNQPFGCTIDPTPEGMQRAAEVTRDVQADKIPIGKAADRLREALGMQRVEVFGTAGDSPIGYVMVEADRHMKQLALGEQAMPDGVKNYMDVIDDTIDRGPPNQLLLRLWFTAKQQAVRADSGRQVFELGGDSIQLSGQNQRALANGQRGQVTEDFRTEAFVGEFNDHWADIRSKYPIYSALESVYRVAGAAELLDRFAKTPEQRQLLDSLAANASSSAWTLPTPQQVESIATLHRVRKGRQVHHVVLASGGVSVDAKQTITAKIADYPSLASMTDSNKSQPKLIQRWWW